MGEPVEAVGEELCPAEGVRCEERGGEDLVGGGAGNLGVGAGVIVGLVGVADIGHRVAGEDLDVGFGGRGRVGEDTEAGAGGDGVGWVEGRGVGDDAQARADGGVAHVVLEVVDFGDGHEGFGAGGAEGKVGGVAGGGGVAGNVDVLGGVDHFDWRGVVSGLNPLLDVPGRW